MKSSFKKLPGSKIELEVSLDKKEFLPYYQAVYERTVSEIEIKGFRKGAVPKEMADRFIDKDEVFNEAAREAVRWSLDEISKDNDWTIIDQPKIEIKDSEDLGIQYKAELTVFPEVKLGNYKKIAHQVMKGKKEQVVEQKEIDQTLEFVRNSRKTGDQLPELNDEFAKSLGKFENLDQLKKSVADGLKMERDLKEQDRLRIKMLEEIAKDSKIDMPEIMVEKTAENIQQRVGPMLKANGKSEEEIKKEVRRRAEENVAQNLVLYKIAQAEKLEPKPEEVDEKGNYQHNYDVIQTQRVFAFLERQ
ncbi:MAG: hypothetical protein HYT03_02055 [Candidatus Harrisonbacteria bacterium]|nr:hypothetical protein [Candidatus Harrisonbacteria bacterium]